MARILLVEDEPSLGRTLCERLQREKYDVTWAQAIAAAETDRFGNKPGTPAPERPGNRNRERGVRTQNQEEPP